MAGALTRHRLVLILLVGMYSLDQLTKAIISRSLELGASWPTEGFIRATHIYNSGSAFGLFRGQNSALIGASLLGILFLIFVYRSQGRPNSMLRASLGLQLAGAAGNLTDRLAHGRVIDFIDIGPWPIFNVADSCIVIGVLLLVRVILSRRNGQDSRREEDASMQAASSGDEGAS